MIVLTHVATGAATGALTRSRSRALLLGPFLHVAQDHLPHEDIPSRRVEIASGVASVALLARRRGWVDPVTLGALAAAAPDLEHVMPRLRPQGRELFHRSRDSDELRTSLSVKLQVALAAAVLGALLWADVRTG